MQQLYTFTENRFQKCCINECLFDSSKSASSASNPSESDTASDSTVDSPVSLTLSVVGDCTLGTDETFDYDTSLNAYYENYGADYFLQNVKSIFCR